jgi:flagellar motility protein MotE (MotC chaperone)
MSTRKKRTTANSTKGASSSLDEEPNLSTLLTQGEALPESDAAHEAELAKLRKEAEELARTKKRLLAIQHEAEIQKQKAEIASLKEELRALKAKQLLTVNSCIKVRLDLQADKSPVVDKGPFSLEW